MTTSNSMIIPKQPNATLYIKNIDWKIKKRLLRRSLYSLFTRHGKVLEIIALRKDNLRGQAFVIMDTIQSATAAMNAEQGFTFFGKDLVIEYANEVSNRISRRDGTYIPKSKRQKLELSSSTSATGNAGTGTTGVGSTNNDSVIDPSGEIISNTTENTELGLKKEEVVVEEELGIPSNILLATNLPNECNEMVLGMLFQQYNGYKEVRMPRPGLAFIEFIDEPHATIARRTMNGFKLTPTTTLNLVYANN